MRHLVLFALAMLLFSGLCACTTTTWNARAYDLSGKEIYRGEVVTTSPSLEMKTPAGKKIQFHNATVVFEEK